PAYTRPLTSGDPGEARRGWLSVVACLDPTAAGYWRRSAIAVDPARGTSVADTPSPRDGERRTVDEADTGDGTWMTYGQLADARQIGNRAAVRLAQRHHLRRQPGNDGSVRIWVPADMATSSPFRPYPPASSATANGDAGDALPADAAPFQPQALAAFEA